jgi:hypothetical protein
MALHPLLLKLSRTCGVSAAAILAAAAAPPTAPRPVQVPIVANAQVPFYPEILRKAHIEGTVKLTVTTDGKRVSKLDAVEGQPMLVTAATENVKTWVFEAHDATSFGVTFKYRLLEAHCDAECRCDSLERPGTMLRLPTEVNINATEAMICDPSTTRPSK